MDSTPAEVDVTSSPPPARERANAEGRERHRVSTRRLGSAIVTSLGASAAVALTAAPAQANAPRHSYFAGCVNPGHNANGHYIEAPLTGGFMSNWGHGYDPCSGGTNQGFACVTESESGTNYRGAGNYLCGTAGQTVKSSSSWGDFASVRPVVRMAKANQHGHITIGSSKNSF